MTSRLANIRLELQAIFEKGGATGRPPFLKRAPEEDFLLVSDAPRRLPEKEAARALLEQNGFAVFEKGGLWLIDAPLLWYERLALALPAAVPERPREEGLLDVWALAWELMRHPSEISAQPLGLSRQVLKAIETGPMAVTELARALPPAIAVLLRKKAPLPALAGGILAEWFIGKQ